MSEILYLKFEKNKSLRTRTVTLGDAAEMTCSSKAVINRLKTMKLFTFQDVRKGAHTCAARQVCSVLDVVEAIHQREPDLEVQNLGETDFILEYSTREREAPLLLFLKVAAVCVITFFGSAFSIMTFNNDVSVPVLFAQINEWVTGEASDGFTVLELTYSLGLAVGILVFFNHVGARRIAGDPTPIETQMRLYEDDMDKALIQTAGRNGSRRKESS